MASDSKSERTILNGSEDWEMWYEELVATSTDEFWPIADPDQPEELPIPPPRKPEIGDLVPGETEYLNLTAAQQRQFDNARKHYTEDHKQFARQDSALRDLRKHILDTVSITNRTNLRANKSVKEWIRILRDLVEPPKGYLIATAKERYDALFRIRAKPLEWLNKWEKVIAKSQQYDMTEFKNGIWLAQMASWIKPHSAELSLMLYTKSNNTEEQHISSYPAVLRDIRRYLRDGLKPTVRGGAFQAKFDDEEELLEETATRSNKRQRANTTNESTSNKRIKNPCPACEKKGHELGNCWYIFEYLRPDNIRLSQNLMDEAVKRVENNKKLRKQVESLRKKHKKEQDDAE